jgi:hypothetical protein
VDGTGSRLRGQKMAGLGFSGIEHSGSPIN